MKSSNVIDTYEKVLASIGMRCADIEVHECDFTIKPTNYLWNPVGNCYVEGKILDRQAAIHFE